jgi:hypothetical protein
MQELIFKIGENIYHYKTFTAGNVIDIESTKMVYSNNTYSRLVQSGLYGAKFAQEIVECFAVLEVMMPKQFKDDLKIKSLFDLDLTNTLGLMKAYKEQIAPQYIALVDLFKSAFEETQKEDKE